MSDPKVYKIPLKSNVTGWKNVRVQVDVIPTGGKNRMVKLQEEFKVLPLEGDTSSYAVLESTKALINEGSSVEFYVTVTDSLDPWGEQTIQGASFQVEVKLDLSAMAQAAGAIMAGAMGMGFLGGAIAQGLPQEMDLLTGTFNLKAQEVECQLTLSKFRWEPLQKKITEYAEPEELKSLYQSGGILRVPVLVEPQQQANGITLELDPAQAIWDVKGSLNWFGKVYEGQYEDDDHTELIFDVDPGEVLMGDFPETSYGPGSVGIG